MSFILANWHGTWPRQGVGFMTSELFARLSEPGRPVIIDGAMGTELYRRGMMLDQAGWSALGALTHTDLVEAIHADYALAGAEIHITNTFATGRHVLEPIGQSDQVDEINTRAVELCRSAVKGAAPDRRHWIVGSVSTYAHGSSRAALPPLDVLRQTFAEQCALLAEAGVDGFALEMLLDVELTLVMAECAAATGLPYWLGFTCEVAPDGTIICRGGGYRGGRDRRFAEVLRAVLAGLPKGGSPMLAVMHNEIEVTDRALDVVVEAWRGPVVVYPNSGTYLNPGWDFSTVCSEADFVEAAQRWLDRGVAAVGGCCGLGPTHIAALANALGRREM